MNSAAPRRIQRKRTKGWKMPPNTVSVCRPGKWGNPFRVGDVYRSTHRNTILEFEVKNVSDAVARFQEMVMYPMRPYPITDEIKAGLRGKNLACWCPLDQPCHADVLLEIANG